VDGPATSGTLPEPALGRIVDIVTAARAAGRRRLLEPEGLAVLAAAGIEVPAHVVLQPGTPVETRHLDGLPGARVVVKAVAESIAHKSDVGAVMIVERTVRAVERAITAMTARLAGQHVEGFLLEAFIPHSEAIGGELLLALRWTPDFGPVVAVGAGGITAELLANDLRPGRELAIVSPELTPESELSSVLLTSTAVRLAAVPVRGQAPPFDLASLVGAVRRLGALGASLSEAEIGEVEINPLVAGATPIALDVLVRLGPGAAAASASPGRAAARPLHKLPRLLQPRSMAIAGVSGGENIGRTILRNVLRDGFDPAAITVVKPGVASIDGCACVPDVASLPSKVDLFVVAVSATRAAEMVTEIADRDAAESVIVIPGGLEETAGGRDLGSAMRAAIARARARPGGGPLVNGGNCMGIRSTPGRYDTLFIPGSKLAEPSGHPAPFALIAQSGGFVLSRLDRLAGLDPKYVITVGNQLDLTVGDHLANLADDRDIRVFGVYVEGFARLDGRRFLGAARAIRERGGVVVLYRGGRTRQGSDASASHTAAIAGDAAVTIALARGAGVVVAETLEAFDDLLRAFVLLDGRIARGRRLGAMTNAGFECVAIADNLGMLDLARFDAGTRRRIADVLEAGGMGTIVDVHNPIDLTPMGGDAAFAAVAEAIIDSPSVDLAVVGDVPYTTTLQTLPASLDSGEDFTREGSVARLLHVLWARTSKPWVTVVDGGARYDPLARFLEAGGIPTFRTADSALRVLGEVAAVSDRPAT